MTDSNSRIPLTGVQRWPDIAGGVVVGFTESPPPDAPSEFLLAGGFVDLQVNGVESVDFWTASGDDWVGAGARMIRSGVTSYLPTLPTGPMGAYDAALDRIAMAQQAASAAHLPHIEGVHLEGPFLGGAPGSHPPELIRSMDLDWLMGLLDRHPGLVRIVTLAPESDPGYEAISALVERGVVVALGHSTCSYDDAEAAAFAGASLVTHLFNGMGPLHHRAPGLAGAALDPLVGLIPTFIADEVHVHPGLFGCTLHAGGIIVTDGVATGGEYFGQPVISRDGAAYLADGTLTGATTTMAEAVANVAHQTGCVTEALGAASSRPGEVLDLATYAREGFGGRADLVILDAEYAVRHVWVAGEHVYRA